MSLETPLRFGSIGTSSVAKRRCVRATVSSRDTSLNWPSTVCLAMKPVGKPDAGNSHVRFDERGGETGCCQEAQATAPLLDSTIPAGIWLVDLRLLSGVDLPLDAGLAAIRLRAAALEAWLFGRI